MAGPLDVEVVTIVEGELDVLVIELVDDGSVVDAVDGDLAAAVLVVEAVALLAELGDVDGGDTELVFVDVEVGESLLVVGVDLEEDYVFGGVIAEDDLMEELPVSLLGVVAEMPLQAGIEAVGFDVLRGEEILVAEDGGEGLHLDELRLQGAVEVADEAEVDGHEVGDWIVVGNAILRWHSLFGGLKVCGVVEELMREDRAGVGELVHESA